MAATDTRPRFVAWIRKKDLGEDQDPWKIRFRAKDGREAFEYAAREAGGKFGHLQSKNGKFVSTRNLLCIRAG